MNALLRELSADILAKSWEDYNAEELESFVTKYPSSALLQLLLSQKLKETGSEKYNSRWQQTLLYFNNPLLLQHIFNKKEEAPQQTNIADSKSDEAANIPQPSAPEAIAHTTNEPELSIPPLKIEPVDPATASLAFMPYHTVDYFASQGIKLNEAQKEKDKFGQQLKSFTQWLKEMKRLPEATVVNKFVTIDEHAVEKIAEKSVTGENAITQTMADVWIKQGNPGKAIDIYQKLSLQNPSKSAYFAAKIEHLKKSL